MMLLVWNWLGNVITYIDRSLFLRVCHCCLSNFSNKKGYKPRNVIYKELWLFEDIFVLLINRQWRGPGRSQSICWTDPPHLMTESSTTTTMMITTTIRTAAVCTAAGVVVGGTTAWRGNVAEEATWILAITHVNVTMTGGNVAGALRETWARTGNTGETAAEVALWTKSAAQSGPTGETTH